MPVKSCFYPKGLHPLRQLALGNDNRGPGGIIVHAQARDSKQGLEAKSQFACPPAVVTITHWPADAPLYSCSIPRRPPNIGSLGPSSILDPQAVCKPVGYPSPMFCNASVLQEAQSIALSLGTLISSVWDSNAEAMHWTQISRAWHEKTVGQLSR